MDEKTIYTSYSKDFNKSRMSYPRYKTRCFSFARIGLNNELETNNVLAMITF